jgi:hypothetical protein
MNSWDWRHQCGVKEQLESSEAVDLNKARYNGASILQVASFLWEFYKIISSRKRRAMCRGWGTLIENEHLKIYKLKYLLIFLMDKI